MITKKTFKCMLIAAGLLLSANFSWAADELTDMKYDSEKDVYYPIYSETGESTTPYKVLKEYDFTKEDNLKVTPSSANSANPDGFSIENQTRKLIIKPTNNNDVTIWEDWQIYNAQTKSLYLFPDYGINLDKACSVKYTGDLQTNCITDLLYKQGETTGETSYNDTENSHAYKVGAQNTFQARGDNVIYVGARVLVPENEYNDYIQSLIASADWIGLADIGNGKYADQYCVSVKLGETTLEDFTITPIENAPYTVNKNTITFSEVSEATEITISANNNKTTNIKIPSGGIYIKAKSYDLTNKEAYINLPSSYNPSSMTAVNGFSDNSYRYQYGKGARMLQPGLYFASNENALLFPEYGLTSANTFNMLFKEHQNGLVYGYINKVSTYDGTSYGSFEESETETLWSKTGTTSLKGRSSTTNPTCIYTGVDIYVPVGSKVSISVGEVGFTTYSSVLPLSVTSGEVYVLGKKTGTEDMLTATKITKIPAETGLLIKGNAEANIISHNEDFDDTTNNLLVPQLYTNGNLSLTQGIDGFNNYVLGKQNGTVAFYWIGTNAANVAYGKAYLSIDETVSAARSLNISFSNDQTTDINDVKLNSTQQYYNINGLRMSSPQKGINIINGKKIILKK